MKYPPYAFVPGMWPHPTRDPQGHSYGEVAKANTVPFEADAWEACSAYLRGLDLFNHGYYWEAHEAWEGLWRAADESSAEAEMFRGLIKLAAAGVKVRQGVPAAVASLGRAAATHFERVAQLCESERFGGLRLRDLCDFARWVGAHGLTLRAVAARPVEVVFDRQLLVDS